MFLEGSAKRVFLKGAAKLCFSLICGKLLGKCHFQGFVFAASYRGNCNFGGFYLQQAFRKLSGKSNFWASSLAASSFETNAEAPFPGFLFCSNLLGKSHFGASSFVSSSSESCICSVFLSSNLLGNYWDSIFFAAIHWGIPTCELFFCSMLLGKSNFLALCCFRVLRSHNSDMPGEVHRCEVGVILD